MDLRADVNLRPEMNVDGWVLIAPLGSGGNGEVWRAVHPEFGEAALKVLASKKGDRWQRFCDEVAVMTTLVARQGILPLIASSLPAPPSRAPAWLATPIAEPMLHALGSTPSLAEVVDAVLALGSALTVLSGEGIFHRDIKPDNLFRRDDNWEIGDFGLVEYPGKVAVTAGDRRLGPLYFIAPEMLLQPDLAAPGPADVYSLAKTLWVVASGQRYPPQGQIRPDVASHDLSAWVSGAGTTALGVILQSATQDAPQLRPTMGEFTDKLREWRRGDPRLDDRAAEDIRLNYVRSLGDQLAKTVDPQAFSRIEAELRSVIDDARRQSDARQREVLRDSMRQSEVSRRALIDDYGIKAALDLHDSPWIGAVGSGDDFEYAVLQRSPDDRQAELHRARQILLGRPLWWMHSVALAGSLKLRGQEGCEPLATEIATQEVRDHLLEFADHPTLAAAWRLQRALVPASARIAAYGPLEQLSRDQEDRLSAEDRLRYRFGPGRVMMNLVRNVVKLRLREISWLPDELDAAAQEAEAALRRVPIPDVKWEGPMGDPWLQSWSQYSPLVMCGIAILEADPTGDDLLDAPELRQAIVAAARGEFPVLRRVAVPLAKRLDLDA